MQVISAKKTNKVIPAVTNNQQQEERANNSKSINRIWHEYSSESSIHGISYIFRYSLFEKYNYFT